MKFYTSTVVHTQYWKAGSMQISYFEGLMHLSMLCVYVGGGGVGGEGGGAGAWLPQKIRQFWKIGV